MSYEEIFPIEKRNLEKVSKDSFVNLVYDSLKIKKQVLIFNSSKSSSEKSAEKIVEFLENKKIKILNETELVIVSKQILNCIETPTPQCIKLSNFIKFGIAFHHSGLTSKQKQIVEENYKKGLINCISSTPTLAAGLNLPAYKVIIKDYKRYSNTGYNDIPVLEYHQMSGRAGRAGLEEKGICVVLIKNEFEKEKIYRKYIWGESEEILSKLSNENSLRMYLLSLITSDIINTKREITDFFKNTFYSFQYKDIDQILSILKKSLKKLISYKFIINTDEFYVATPLGKKVSKLYLNPDSANHYLENFDNLINKIDNYNLSKNSLICFFHYVLGVLEFSPIPRIYKSEEEFYLLKSGEYDKFLIKEYDPYKIELNTHLGLFKSASIFYDWIEEVDISKINEKYKITPGELNYKLDVIDWLLYCLEEFSKLKKNFFLKNFISKIRNRLKFGVKFELLELINIKGIGKVKARKLFNSNIKTLQDIKKIEIKILKELIGEKTTINILKELGIEKQELIPKRIKQFSATETEVEELLINEEIYENEKKQKSIYDF
jgi:helicase